MRRYKWSENMNSRPVYAGSNTYEIPSTRNTRGDLMFNSDSEFLSDDADITNGFVQPRRYSSRPTAIRNELSTLDPDSSPSRSTHIGCAKPQSTYDYDNRDYFNTKSIKHVAGCQCGSCATVNNTEVDFGFMPFNSIGSQYLRNIFMFETVIAWLLIIVFVTIIFMAGKYCGETFALRKYISAAPYQTT